MSLVKKYKAEVIRIQNKINGIYTVDFISLENKMFRYKPGQFLHLALDEYDVSGQWPESRCFSMQSSPDKDTITITFAVKGKYTRRMEKELNIGSQVYLKLPYGDLFIQDHCKEDTVFIAGGTGITPFLSLMNDESFRFYKNPKLYFGLRIKSFNIYEDEIKNAITINPHLSIFMFYENENGLIHIENSDSDSVARNSTFFISGPPSMIKYFKELLLNKKIPSDKIRTDDWE